MSIKERFIRKLQEEFEDFMIHNQAPEQANDGKMSVIYQNLYQALLEVADSLSDEVLQDLIDQGYGILETLCQNGHNDENGLREFAGLSEMS